MAIENDKQEDILNLDDLPNEEDLPNLEDLPSLDDLPNEEDLPDLPTDTPKKKVPGEDVAPISDTSVEPSSEDTSFFGDLWSTFKAGGTKALAGVVQMAKPLAGFTMSARGASQPAMYRSASGELKPATQEQIQKTQAETQRIATDLFTKGNEISATVEKFDKGIWENLKEGNFLDAGKQTALAMSGSMASMIPIMISPTLIPTMGASSAGMKQLEMKEEMRLGKAKYTPQQIFSTSLAFGTFEAMGDFASAGMFKVAGKVFKAAKKTGKEATEEVAESFIKALLKGSGKEGSGEVVTQMGQNLSDKIIADKDVNLMDGTIDAFIVGNIFSSSTISGSYITGKALGRLSSTADRQKVSSNTDKIHELDLQKRAEGVNEATAQAITEVQQNIAQENVDILVKNRATVAKMTPEQRLTLNDLSKSSEKIDLLLANENLSPEVRLTLTEQKADVEGRKQQLLTSIDEDITAVIEEDGKSIEETQKQLDYLKKQGEPYKDLTIEQIEKRYSELTEKPTETPAKKKVEPKQEPELADLEKRFKDPEVPMTKSEYRAEKKKITQKLKEPVKETKPEPTEKLEVEIIKPKKKQPKDMEGTSASEWINTKRGINKALKGIRGTTELKEVPRTEIKATLQKFADENIDRLTTPQKTAIDKAIGSEMKTRADLNKVLGIMEKSFAPKKRVLIDAWAQQKRQYKESQRVTRETQKYAKENIATVLSQVKQFTKDYKAKLTVNQYNAIVARLGKAIKDPRGLERTLDYVDKVISDRKYAMNFEQAQAFKKNLGKKIKTKEFKKNFAQQMPIIRDFFNLNPNTFDVEDIAEYNKIALSIAKGKLDPEAGKFIGKYERRAAPELDLEVKAAKDIKSMNKVLQTIDTDIKNIQTFDEYKAQSTRLSALRNKSEKLLIDGTITEEEFNNVQNFIERIDSSNEKRLGILNIAELDVKLNMVDEIDINKAVVDEAILPEGSKEIYQDLNKLNRQQITKLPLSMVNRLNNAVYNLSNGNITADLFNVHNYIQQQNIKTKGIDTVSDAVLNTTSRSVKKLTKNVKKLTEAFNLRNVYLWDYVLNTENTRAVATKIFRPLVVADTKADIKRKESTHRFNKALNKFKATKFVGKQKSLHKIGILRIEKRYRNNPIIIEGKAYKWDEVPNEYKNKHGFLLGNISSVNSLGGYESNAYQNINKAYTDLTFAEDGTLDIDKSIENLSSIEKELYEASTEAFDALKGLNQSNAIKAGELWVDSKDYTAEYVIQGKAKGETESIEAETNKVFDKPYQPVTKISGAIFRKTGKLFFAETDISKVVNRHARETTHNAYVNDAYTNVNAALTTALKELEITPKGGAYVAVDALKRATRDNVIHTYVDRVYQLEQIGKTQEALKRYSRTRLLIKPARPAAELTSNLAGAVITNSINPLNAANYKANAKYEVLIRDEGSPLINKISKYTEMQNPNEMSRMSKATNSIITVADNVISKPIFIKNFNTKFKELTGENFNIDKYLSDVDYKEQFSEAISDATSFGEIMVSEEFNALSSISQATKTKVVPFGKAVGVNTTAAKVLSFMMSFNTQEAAMAKIGLQQIARGEVRRGTALIGGRIVRNTTYSFMRQMLTLGMFAAVGDKDEEKLEKLFSPENYYKSAIAGTMSLMVGRYGNIYRPATGLFLGGLAELERYTGKKTTPFTKEMNEVLNMIQYTKPIKQYGNTFDAVSYIIPAYAIGVEDAFMGTIAMGKMGLNLLEGKEMTSDEKVMWESLAAINAAITFAYPNPFTPALRDISTKKAQSMKKKKSKGQKVYR